MWVWVVECEGRVRVWSVVLEGVVCGRVECDGQCVGSRC